MKGILVLAAVCAATFTLAAEEYLLPAPQKNGGISLNEALNLRKTCRQFTAQTLSQQQISQLFWSAFGVNREDGKRTAPTARNRQEITLYLLTAKGAWIYEAKAGKMVSISNKDLRKFAGRFTAPAYIVIVTNKKLLDSTHFADIDTGYVSQNIYLACAGMKLGTCAIGRIPNSTLLALELRLTDSERVQLAHSVGVPK